MAAVSMQKRARLDMRMTEAQRREIEHAAAIKGMSLTQWALENLLSAARRDVSEESTTRLSIDAFDEFKNALDDGMTEEARRLLQREPVWK